MLGNEWVLALVCVLFFYGAGAQEARFGARNHALLWTSLSIALSALVVLVLKGGWTSLLLAQVGLFVAIGIVRAWRAGR